MGLAGPVVVVEDEDGRHHTRRHHEHDSIEVSGWNRANKMYGRALLSRATESYIAIWYNLSSNGEDYEGFIVMIFVCCVSPIRGLFEVMGMMEETVLRNIVSDSRIVTPTIDKNFKGEKK